MLLIASPLCYFHRTFGSDSSSKQRNKGDHKKRCRSQNWTFCWRCSTLPRTTKHITSWNIWPFIRIQINISQTYILTINYTSLKAIWETYRFNWNLTSIKYLDVTVTQDPSNLWVKLWNTKSRYTERYQMMVHFTTRL